MQRSEKALKIERQLSTTVDSTSSTVHDIDKAATQQRNRSSSDVTEHLNDITTDFSAEARTGQVLRWVNTAALLANSDEKRSIGRNRNRQPNPKFTPEAQAAVVGGRILMGTNADNDSDIPAKLRTLVSNDNVYKAQLKKITDKDAGLTKVAATQSDKEKLRVNQQDARHLTQLRQFVSDDSFRNKFVGNALQEIRDERNDDPLFKKDGKQPISLEDAQGIAQRFSVFEDKINQTRSIFSTIQQSLDTSNTNVGRKVEMATNVSGQHAEQRVIETVQKNQQVEETATRAARHKELPQPPLPFSDEVSPEISASLPQQSSQSPRSAHETNRTVDPWTNVATYRIPEHKWNLKSAKRQKVLARLAAYNKPTPTTDPIHTDIIASESTLIANPRSLTPTNLMIPLGGTKPPCDMCETTEQARHDVAIKGQTSPMVITRFEDRSNRVGIQFTGKYAQSTDQRVQNSTTVLLGDTAREPRAQINTRKRADSTHQ